MTVANMGSIAYGLVPATLEVQAVRARYFEEYGYMDRDNPESFEASLPGLPILTTSNNTNFRTPATNTTGLRSMLAIREFDIGQARGIRIVTS